MPMMLYVPKVSVSQFVLMWGLSTQPVATSEMVLGLATKSSVPKSVNRTFALTAPSDSGLFMYFAAPASYGPVQFYDQDNFMYGGWDGANDNPFEVYGPLVLDVLVGESLIPYNVYRTDWPDLGLCHWQTSPFVE